MKLLFAILLVQFHSFGAIFYSSELTNENQASLSFDLPVKESNLDITTSDGLKLKATYYSPEKPGPGMLLLHQCNMNRKSWESLATSLAKSGIHVLTFDYRGWRNACTGKSL